MAFGKTLIAKELRTRRPTPHASWHLDEMHLTMAGRMFYITSGAPSMPSAKCSTSWLSPSEISRLR
jgi:transposase-like protein